MATYKGYSSVGKDFYETDLVDSALIRADLINHFNTRPGERLMNPDFGCLVWNYLFDPFTDEVKYAVVENLQEIVKQDPRVVLRSIDIVEYEHGLQVDLDLVYADTDQTEYMRVAFDQRTENAIQF